MNEKHIEFSEEAKHELIIRINEYFSELTQIKYNKEEFYESYFDSGH